MKTQPNTKISRKATWQLATVAEQVVSVNRVEGRDMVWPRNRRHSPSCR